MLNEAYLFRRRTDRASILIVSLWVVTLLSAFAVSAGYQVRQKITLSDRLDIRGWLNGLAESGVEKAVTKLKEDKVENGFDTFFDLGTAEAGRFGNLEAPDGGATAVSYIQTGLDGTRQWRYGLIDEERKLNVNTADAETLSRLLQIFEVEEDLANEIAYAITDWRDTDSFLSNPSFGAEDDYYEDLKVSYGAKDQPFEVRQELLLVRSMTPEIYDRIKNYVTVFGGGSVNINTASEPVLSALGLGELAKKIINYCTGPDGQDGTADDEYFATSGNISADLSAALHLSGAEMAVVSNLVAAGKLGVASSFFEIHSRGMLKQREIAIDIESIVDRSGKVVYWTSGLPRKMTEEEIRETLLQDVE